MSDRKLSDSGRSGRGLSGTGGQLPAGVVLSPMDRALEADATLSEKLAAAGLDMAGMNPEETTLLFVPDGVILPQPLQLVNILRAGESNPDVSRLAVVVGERAEAKLLVCQHCDDSAARLVADNRVDIMIGRGASFDYYDLEETTEHTERKASLNVVQESDSRAVIDMLTLYNGVTHNSCRCEFRGEGADLKLYGMAICDKRRKLRFDTHIEHGAPRCHSDELYKISADDEADCSFSGRIKVCEGAVGTEAYQASRNLLNGDRARIQAQPELEIYNDDVKCSHGCAIGQLDPLQVFYMRTRGVPDEEARLLLRQAFMADVIDAIRIPVLNQRLRLLVERRFAGEGDAACGACLPK